jgi:hypothetical protein
MLSDKINLSKSQTPYTPRICDPPWRVFVWGMSDNHGNRGHRMQT